MERIKTPKSERGKPLRWHSLRQILSENAGLQWLPELHACPERDGRNNSQASVRQLLPCSPLPDLPMAAVIDVAIANDSSNDPDVG